MGEVPAAEMLPTHNIKHNKKRPNNINLNYDPLLSKSSQVYNYNLTVLRLLVVITDYAYM